MYLKAYKTLLRKLVRIVEMATHGERPSLSDSGYDYRRADKESHSCTRRMLIIMSFILVVLTFPFCLMFILVVIKEYERAVIFRLGRLREGGPRGPGLFYVVPCIDVYRKVDLRTVSFDVPPQEALSKDAVTVTVDAAVYYRVQDPFSAVVRVRDYSGSTKLLSMTTLRNVLGTRDLSQILIDRDNISATMQKVLDDATDPWGVKVERVEIKDVRLPYQLQRAMAAEAQARREAKAKVIAAQGEIKAAIALQEASLKMMDNPMTLQLRYLQALNTINHEETTAIIFPFPIDLIRSYLSR